MTLMDMIERLAGFTRINVAETHRALILRKGRFAAILGPGEHRMRLRGLTVQMHDLASGRFVSAYEGALFRERPDLVADHLTEVRVGEGEVAVVARDGRLFEVLRPEARAVFWTEAGPWAVDRVALTETLEVPEALGLRLTRSGLTVPFTSVEVPEAHVGLLTVDGAEMRTLRAGTHRFWTIGRKLAVKLIDMRLRSHEVTGQEILTRDRVTLRVNLAAEFRVADPLKAATSVKDFEDALHRAVQMAFRKTLGALTLDQLLADKVAVDAEAADAVRAEMAALGVEVGAIALKDVILPGEMRDILNRVVSAQKEAEANVIRRREETNATRSLLNTAKVMAENPMMLRLKELEALETVAGKIERLTVHNGTAGLLTDLVKLRD